ncbi:MAG TPA: tetratricopeptide repeat protein [Planctomycetota bacterium]
MDRRPWLVALALALLAFGLYARSGGFGYVEYDDPAYVRDNPHLAEGLTPASLRWALISTDYQYNWHPLTWLSHALDVELFGAAPGPRHLENALLHALAAALLFRALVALGLGAGASALTAALFALHPVRVESVAWLAQRKDLLAGVACMATLWSYARFARAPSPERLLPVALTLALGLMAKPTLVALPAALLLLDAWPLGRTRTTPLARLVREKLPLFLLAAAAAGVTLLAQGESGAVKAVALPVRLANAAESIAAYARVFLWPPDLAVFYPHPALVGSGPSTLRALAVALGLAALLGLAWRARARAGYVLAGLGWFLVMLAPMLGLVQVGFQARADRYAYLPQLGLELALVSAGVELARRRPAWRGALVALALAWLAGLGWCTARQLARWRDSATLFRHALAVTERNFVAHNNLGLVLAREGRLDEALEHFEAAATARPGFFEAELNVGLAREQRGELDAARAALERAVAARPASGAAHLALARVRLGLGDARAADAELARALELDPSLAEDPRARSLGAELERRLEEPR